GADREKGHRRSVREHAELRAAYDVGRVLDLEREPQVRLVGAVASRRLVPRDPRERRLELDATTVAPDARDDLLDQSEQLVDVRERGIDLALRQLLETDGA